MSGRYFVDQRIGSKQVQLIGAEAHHLLHVMRATPGDEVTLFDGSGAEFSARVVTAGRSEMQLEVIARLEIDRELGFELILGVALPKGDRQKWLVEKCVELGVTQIVPLQTTRAVAKASSSSLQRLGRWIVEASKQCGRNRLLEIGRPLALSEFLTSYPGNALRLLAHPSGAAMANLRAQRTARVMIAVGPEGGFTSDEVSLAADAHWKLVSLGTRILRIETAAIAVASAVALWD